MRFLLPLLLLLLLPGVVFAQKDVGELIFRDIFKMADYPGAPFTGNIINDLVMFLFIPTVFIIVIITVLVLRLGLPSEKLAVLLGIAFYMFIVFGGYYSMFALLAGPYFLFLIVIMGIFVFFLGHFGIARGGPMPGRAAGGGMPGGAVAAAEGDILIKLEDAGRRYTEAQTTLAGYRAELLRNPHSEIGRVAQEQTRIVDQTRREFDDLKRIADKMKAGHEFKNNLRSIRHRYGL